MNFTPGMMALLSAKLTPQTAHQCMVLGRRFAAPEAVSAGIIDGAFPENDLLSRGLEYTRTLVGKDAATIAAIKSQLYANALTELRTPL
jgi:Delta3-Delta2-enoyl-CoA isomerase